MTSRLAGGLGKALLGGGGARKVFLGGCMSSKLDSRRVLRGGAGRAASGFTVIELMIALAILSILVGIATPTFKGMLASQRVKTVAADLHTSLLQARAEAIKRNQRILLRPASGESWSDGWLVPDPASPTSDANPLFRYRPNSGVEITSAASQIEFRPNGRVSAAAALEIESNVDSSKTRCVAIGLDGRASSGACGG